jgi:hypothetical protein
MSMGLVCFSFVYVLLRLISLCLLSPLFPPLLTMRKVLSCLYARWSGSTVRTPWGRPGGYILPAGDFFLVLWHLADTVGGARVAVAVVVLILSRQPLAIDAGGRLDVVVLPW